MLDIYRKQFESITDIYVGDAKDVRLARLMTELEAHYRLSANRQRFERETPADVKELYLAVSNARTL